ncbi:hypothetical protein D6C98_00446 [Aureobasidium pullulans]|nr:hypothetical protein D6C98_00446 [Aureobasidium pullulans]
MSSSQSVQCFGKKKTATAVAHCKQGQGLIKVNGQPISLVQPEILRFKVYEPVLILGLDKFEREDEGKSMGQFGEWMGTHTAAHANLDIVFGHESLTGFSSTAGVDIRVRVSGGGHTSQVYAIRQAIAKSIIAYYQKFVDEHSKNQLKQALVAYDRTLLVADNRRCEPKKFGGKGARSRFQKSYR